MKHDVAAVPVEERNRIAERNHLPQIVIGRGFGHSRQRPWMKLRKNDGPVFADEARHAPQSLWFVSLNIDLDDIEPIKR